MLRRFVQIVYWSACAFAIVAIIASGFAFRAYLVGAPGHHDGADAIVDIGLFMSWAALIWLPARALKYVTSGR
jgi:hypothetical protein